MLKNDITWYMAMSDTEIEIVKLYAEKLAETSKAYAVKAVICAGKMLGAVDNSDFLLADYYKHESGRWGLFAAVTKSQAKFVDNKIKTS